MRLASLLPLLGLVGVLSCGSTGDGDPHSDGGVPPVGGKDKRIKDVSDPTLPGHASILTSSQAVSGAIVVAVDTFDETANGKSIGTIYVQDVGSTDPYSGTSLFAPTFNPGNLAVSAGDVLDLRGSYQETTQIGSTVQFASGSWLPQFSKPVATFRYETQIPEPRDIDVKDLADFKVGRKWMGMLVRVKNITLASDGVPDSNGRVAAELLPGGTGSGCKSPFPKAPILTNSLFDVGALGLKIGQKLTSVVGVVGFFCNIQLAPRSKADIQQ